VLQHHPHATAATNAGWWLIQYKIVCCCDNAEVWVAAITSQTSRFHKQATNPQEVTPEQLIQSVLLIFQGKIATQVSKSANGTAP